MIILDLGCGPVQCKYKGAKNDTVVGLDSEKRDGVDVVWDLNKLPLPFKAKSFDKVNAAFVFEHLNNFIKLFREIHRILKRDGLFEIKTVHFTNPSAYSCEHNSFWGYHLMEDQTVIRELFTVINKEIKLVRPFGWLEPLINRMPFFYEWRLCYMIPAKYVHFILKKVSKK